MKTGAVLLAGGRGARLGGTDKGALVLHGTSLLDRALAALTGIETVVVGPPRPGARTVREDPPRSGPAAAVCAGLAALPEVDEVLLLAVDVPGLPTAVPRLLAAEGDADGVVAVDGDGREQWLLGRYDAAAVRRAAGRLGDPADAPLRALLGGLRLARLPLPPELTADVDTVADAVAAGIAPLRSEGGAAVSDDVGATLDAWWATLTEALGLTDVPAVREAILGLAGEAAHGVVRPAAPVTTFLAGYAAGLAGGSAADVDRAIATAGAAVRA